MQGSTYAYLHIDCVEITTHYTRTCLLAHWAKTLVNSFSGKVAAAAATHANVGATTSSLSPTSLMRIKK
jgi:hypothetical protein